MHLAITGNIGAGKTTLARLLGQELGWEVLYEAVDDNPYLTDFYADMPRWAFHTQVYFLNTRLAQVRRIAEASGPVIQDRTIYEDAHIFAAHLHATGRMTDRDFATYRALFAAVQGLVRPPDLLLYLRADLPHLLARIRQRDRPYERNLSPDYLRDLNHQYEAWIGRYQLGKLLIVDAARHDYARYPNDLAHLVAQVRSLTAPDQPAN